MNDLSGFNLLANKLGGRNLYLVGMMGSGKSSAGPFLAKNLSYSFVDVDQIIEHVAKRSIPEIFEAEGEVVFRDLETQVLKEIGKRHSLVVATGGGVVIRPENWGILHQGVVIWLDVSRQIILERLQSDQTSRPLLENNLIENFDSLLLKRRDLYLEADLRITIDQESSEEVALQILANLRSMLNKNLNSSGQQTIE